MKTKSIIGKPETWPKKVKPDYCLCGAASTWHKECYLSVPLIKSSVRSIMSYGEK